MIEVKGETFLFCLREGNGELLMEVVMLGSGEECKKYVATISVKDSKGMMAFASSKNLRAIEKTKMEDEGCFSIKKKGLAQCWTLVEGEYEFKVEIKIETLVEVERILMISDESSDESSDDEEEDSDDEE